jgi:hypothetical protein
MMRAGDALVVNLGTGGGSSPLLVTASGSGLLQIQIPDGRGGWRVASETTPRIDPDQVAFPAPGSDSIRIATRAYANLSYVGVLAQSASVAGTHEAQLISAQHSGGDVRDRITAEDSTSVTLAGPDTLNVTYSLPEATSESRDYFLALDATQLDPRTVAPTRLSQGRDDIPTRFSLYQNRPNPFQAGTAIHFDLPVGAMVRLEVFDAQGRRVGLPANRFFPAGRHSVNWGPGESGARPNAGVYFYRISAGSFRDRKKMVLLP